MYEHKREGKRAYGRKTRTFARTEGVPYLIPRYYVVIFSARCEVTATQTRAAPRDCQDQIRTSGLRAHPHQVIGFEGQLRKAADQWRSTLSRI